MYKLYIWNPWNFGQWIYKGEFATKQEANKQIKNKRETTYKVIKDDNVVEYHEAQGYCWRYGMVRPKSIKVRGVTEYDGHALFLGNSRADG